MSMHRAYNVEFTTEELESLRECLAHLRKRIDHDYEQDGLRDRREPIQDAIFRSACELQFKIAKVLNPDTTVTLQDFLNYGNYGLNN